MFRMTRGKGKLRMTNAGHKILRYAQDEVMKGVPRKTGRYLLYFT